MKPMAISLDGRFSALQEQALAALTNHAQILHAPPQRLLDDLSSFQRVLFTDERVRALWDAVRQGAVPLPDPDRTLNALERQGKAVFERACSQCHGGPGQSTPQATLNNPPAPVVRYHTILSQCPVPSIPRQDSCSRRARHSWLEMSALTPLRCRSTRQLRPGCSGPGPSSGGRRPIPAGRC
jgi:hypothetical protein